MFQKYRKSSKEGGVLIYIRECLRVKLREDLMQLREHEVESVWVELFGKTDKKLLWGTFYRPPNSSKDYDTAIREQIIQSSLKGDMIIVGDFNYPTINWNSLTAGGREEQYFLSKMQDCFLEQHVMEPTREGNVLDLIFSTNGNYVDKVEIREHLSDSDHCSIGFTVELDTKKTINNRIMPCFWKAKFQEFKKEVKEAFQEGIKGNNIEEIWNHFTTTIELAMKHWIPYENKNKIKYTSPPWFGIKVREKFYCNIILILLL